MTIVLKVIDKKIVEKDFSLVVSNKPLTSEEAIKEIKEQYRFEDDKTEMNEKIKEMWCRKRSI
jgi:uncharacterized protein YueI